MTRREWKTIRAVVEVQVPVGTHTEKDLVWAVNMSVRDIDSRLRARGNPPMSLIAVKQFGKMASANPQLKAVMDATPLAPAVPKKPDVEWCKRQLQVAEGALAELESTGVTRAVGGTISVLLEMLDPS